MQCARQKFGSASIARFSVASADLRYSRYSGRTPMDFELSPGQKELQARARAMAEAHMAPRAAEIDRTEAYPWDHIERLRVGGFLGMTIPKIFGGQGLGYFDAVLVIEEMAKHC